MKLAPKITLILGGLMLVGSIIAIAVGFGSTDFDGEEVFSGDAPTTWTADLEFMSAYEIYFQDGSNVSVEMKNGGQDNRFVPCVGAECNDYRQDYKYAGTLQVIDSGTYDVEFSGTGSVMVFEIETGGFIAAGLGFWCGCCSLLVLIVGLIMALVMKDNQVAQVVVMPGQVQAVPVAGVSPVPIGIDYSDPAQSYYANMMAQGFDSAQAAEITREQYPGFNQ
jgi:hypothetical protein